MNWIQNCSLESIKSGKKCENSKYYVIIMAVRVHYGLDFEHHLIESGHYPDKHILKELKT